MPSMFSRPLPWAVVLLALAACGERGAPTGVAPADGPRREVSAAAAAVPAGARLVLTTGNGQSGSAGGPLVTPLGVRLFTAAGQPIAGASVTWAVTAGGGSLSGIVATTDAYGVSRATAELGPLPGTNTVQASVATAGGTQTVTFTLRGVAPPAVATLEPSGGDGQRFAPGFPLEQPLVVRAFGPGGRPVANAVVRWATPSGGTFRMATSVTNVNGYAYGFWTLGPAEGAQTATATVAGVAPVTFRAQSDAAARPVVATIGLGLNNRWLEPGERSSFYAVALSARGLAVPGTEITWTVDRPDLLAIRPIPSPESGTSRLEFTALAPGDATITVTAAGISRTIPVRVFPPGGRPRGGDGCGGCA